MGSRVLITGARGMVGRNLLECVPSPETLVLAPPRSQLDLLDPFAIERYLREHRPDTVIHAAGRVGGIAANMENQAGFLAENVLMGLNLARAAADSGVSRFLNLSSSCVYPRSAESPLSEGDLFQGQLEPTNEGYALAKLIVLRFGEFLAAEHSGMGWVSLIPSNLYGRWDHFEPARSHLVPAIIRKIHDAMRDGLGEVSIWGSGEVRREFMLASDFASAVWRALDVFDQLPRRVNIGVGRDHSVNDYYQVAAEVMGYSGGFVHDLTKPTGMPRKQVDIEIQTGFGWTDFTDLRDGIDITYDFFLKHAQS